MSSKYEKLSKATLDTLKNVAMSNPGSMFDKEKKNEAEDEAVREKRQMLSTMKNTFIYNPTKIFEDSYLIIPTEEMNLETYVNSLGRLSIITGLFLSGLIFYQFNDVVLSYVKDRRLVLLILFFVAVTPVTLVYLWAKSDFMRKLRLIDLELNSVQRQTEMVKDLTNRAIYMKDQSGYGVHQELLYPDNIRMKKSDRTSLSVSDLHSTLKVV